MGCVSDTWKSVLFVLAVAKFTTSVHIACEENSHCDISDTCTAADFFVHQYIPTNVKTVNYINLAVDYASSALFSTIPPFVKEVQILKSKHLKWLVISGLSNIANMNIAYTGLNRIDVDKNNALNMLFVADSNILRISPSISNLKTCTRLEVTNCLVEALDMGLFCDMPQLRLLSFFGNRIKTLQNSATNNCSVYSSLTTLILSRNFLKTLNMEVFHPFQGLDSLTLSENKITAVLGTFETDTELELFLVKNKLKSFTLCGWNVPRMKWLELQYNNLSTVPTCLEKLASVTDFKLAYNNISHVTIESFARMHSLMHLELSYNNMTSIELNSTRYPANLRKLWIAGNNLTELDLTVVPVNELQVYAQENFIQNMEVDKIAPTVVKLCMSYNPLDCSWTNLEERLNLTCTRNDVE